MLSVVSEIRTTVRVLLRRPLIPAVEVSVLTLGLTAAIAVFTYINGFFQPFPGVDPVGLVRLFGVTPEDPYQDISYLDFLDYARADGAFAGIGAAQTGYAASVRREGMTEVAFLEAVSGTYFAVLGVELHLGRGIRADDDRPGANPVAVISYDWWQRSFNADSSILGSTLYLNFRPFTVVAVASPLFRGATSGYRPDVWIPFAPFRDRYTSWAMAAENRDLPLVRVYARLRDGRRAEQGLSELNAVASGLDEAYPKRDALRQLRLDAATWIDPRARLGEQATLRMMSAAAIGLLLLVGANVANLLLSVALGRSHEFALRAALGASRARLIRSALVENVILSSVAGGLALWLATPVTARLGSYFARPSVWGENVTREVSVDLRVIAFAVVISILTGVLAGLIPAIRASGGSQATTLRAGAGELGRLGRTPARGVGVHDALMSLQVALSIVLLVVAGLVVRTFSSVATLDPGFAYENLMVTHISTSSTTLQPNERDRFFRDLAANLTEEPWVRSATIVDFPLLSPHPTADFRADGLEDPQTLVYSKVIPGFFGALDIDVVAGRDFVSADTAGARDVAVVNQRFVDRYLANVEAVGRTLWWIDGAPNGDRAFDIVGIVRDTKTRDYFTEPEPTIYFSYPQHPYPTGSALITSINGDPRNLVAQLNGWLRNYEPYLAIVNVVPYADVIRGYQYTQRMNAELFAVMAFFGVALAAVGIFNVMSLAVVRRTKEIGIRMSIGAAKRDISRMVIARALPPVVLGLGVGLIASLAMARLVRGLLFGVNPIDPTSLAVGTIVFFSVAALAAFFPAYRAATIDPVRALRQE